MTGGYVFTGVCPFTFVGGGGTPSQVWTGVPYHRSGWEGYPIPGLDWGVPHPRCGWGRYPIQGEGYPVPGLDGGGYPIPGVDRGTHQRSGWEGYPIPGLDWGYPTPGVDGGGTPSKVRGTLSQVWMGGVPHPADGGYPI